MGKKIKLIEHGPSTELTEQQSLKIAGPSNPDAAVSTDDNDPMGLCPGNTITISAPDGSIIIKGDIVSLSPNHLTIKRSHTKIGSLCVHFPRIGYHIKKIKFS